MSGTSENRDPVSALGSSIHLNEDDWLQLLQKLTPSSINNLQQTLKRIQQQELSTTSSDVVNAPPTSFQRCGSVSSLSESAVLQHQGTPIVMSLGIPKTTVPSVITVPPVLNVSKASSSPLHNAIVLPSSALLIAPSESGRTISIDPLIPVSGINRFVVTSDCLVAAQSKPTATVAAVDTFSSLNTLANAAVAVAENASNQIQWSSGIFGLSKPATTVKPVRFSTASPDGHSTTITAPVFSNRTTVDGLLTSLCHLQSSDVPSQLFPTAGATGLTVYPLQVSANGSTVFLTASPSVKSATIARGLNIVGTSASRTASQVSPVTSAVPTNSLISCCSSPLNTTPTSADTVCCGSSASINPAPVLTSTPRAKPKFKALWETSLQIDGDQNTSIAVVTSDSLNSVHSSVGPTDVLNTSSPNPLPSSGSQRQSPMLRVKSIGQTPKRLAASAASFSDEQSSPSQDGSKKLLLLCSQSKNSEDYAFSTISSESSLARGLNQRIPSLETTRLDGTETGLENSDRKDVYSSRPLTAQPINPSNSRSTVCPLSVDQISATVMASTRGEILLSKSFDGSRRILKEEPVGEDEARRRAKRRERNRVAAARCRQRRQDQIVELQHRVGILTKTGEELRSTLHSLSTERSRLEALIREHGLAGCAEAQELLGSLSSFTDTSDTPCTYVDEPLDTRLSSTSRTNLQEMACTSISATSDPSTSNFLMITNRSGVKLDPDAACLAANNRPTLTKLDIGRASQSASLLGSVAPKKQVCDSESTSNTNGDVVMKPEEPDTHISGSGPSLLIGDSIQRQSSPLSVPSTTAPRLAARPSTLLPPKAVTESSQLMATQGAATEVLIEGLPTCTAGSSTGTPVSCFWPSDLQTFSPILTPSTWKLLKNLTSGSCSTPQSFILTPNFSSLYQTLSISNLGSPVTSGLFTPSTGGVSGSRSPSNSAAMNVTHNSVVDAVTGTGKTVSEDSGVSSDGVQSSYQTVLLSFMNCDKPEKVEDVNTSDNV